MKSVKSSFARALTVQMAERGYALMALSMPTQTIYAFEKAINSEMYCHVDFRYMASPKAYDVGVGVGSVVLQTDVDRALEKFSMLSGGLSYTARASETAPCVLFNADVFTKAEFGEVLPANTELLPLYLETLFSNAVEPVFEAVMDRVSLLRLLLRTDPPFNRSMTSQRLLLIAKLTHETNSDWSPIRTALMKIERYLRNDAYIEKYPGPLIDDAYAYFATKNNMRA